ncbi:hypothetical protein TRFO_38744 [Tritrichomonas foetus]|uniref:Uncharacterized protein n=1 Tax=Tritrichomonas foetus TaxID=1144522 RepID=A0A1J4J766_9EUKA|nr:hypothetical protein TRFO_38744 [Tritrichomonas foetus]|eukprot:OHS95074.1 hypothetical protein TRFO_38744 [Tritrichomonas foetus]
MMKKVKGGKQFGKLFGTACGDFNIVNNEGVDHFLVPVDLDIPHQALLCWMQYKTTKVPKHFKLTAVHFYSTPEVNSKTNTHFSELCNKFNITFISKKVEQPANRTEYNQILLETATENECNKIAIPDSIDYLNAFLLTNMASGMFSGASIVQKMQLNDDKPEVLLTRPFCYATDKDIQKFGENMKYENEPTGIRLEEEPFMETARKGISMLMSESTNVSRNFFKSQFTIQKKYVGIGEDKVLLNPEDDIDSL